MNILHINDKIEINGGVETYVHQLYEYSGSYGISAFWLGVYKNINYQLKWFNETELQKSNLNLEQVLTYLNQIVERHAIDIIHIHSLSNPTIINHCFSLVPVVRSMHEPRIVCPGQGKFWRKSERMCNKPFGFHCLYHAYTEGCSNRHPRRLKEAYNNVKFETTEGKENYKAIIAMSAYMVDEALKVGYKKDQLYFNPYFTEHVDNKELVDQSVAITKSIIFIGRLSRTKGVHYFIECGIRLLEEGHNVHLDIVGDGHDAEYFSDIVPDNLKKHFTFHGWQSREEIDRLIKESYLMVFPSVYPEAFGISGIEAIMRGKPVVGFDVGGVSTWLKDGESGFSVPVKDIESLAEKTMILLQDSNLYKKMSKSSREIALSEFCPDKHMNELRDMYDKILNNECR